MKGLNKNRKASGCDNTFAGYFSIPKSLSHKIGITMNTSKKQYLCKHKCDQLQFLKSACRRRNEAKVLTIVWQNQGLLTHEIGDKFGCKSNNHHNVTRDLNPRLIKLGWVITKYHAGNTNGSWRWFVEPVLQALANPIRDSLRATIIENMEAANDE